MQMRDASLRDTTLLFLVRRDEAGTVSEICLAMKKRGFGIGKYNGVGGKRARLKSQRHCEKVKMLVG